jgi:CheY-like chemotaxis protein
LRKFDLSINNTELVLALNKTLPQTSASPDQFQQLLIILMNNALQAMGKMTQGRCLKISTTKSGDCIRVAVEDTGPGVPAEIQGKIFEPFFTTKGVGTGTGLGLSIAHSIMTEHQGQIHYERSPIGGAAFVMELPVKAVRVPTGHITEALEAEPRISGPATSRQEKILVVDDEKPIVEMLGEMLGLLGYAPTLCTSAAEALEKMDQTEFDLVLSDVRMPQIDGQEFYRQASRKNLAFSQRFVFLTGDTINQETKAFLSSVGSQHISKPFRFSSIQEVVKRMLPTPTPALARVPVADGQRASP